MSDTGIVSVVRCVAVEVGGCYLSVVSSCFVLLQPSMSVLLSGERLRLCYRFVFNLS